MRSTALIADDEPLARSQLRLLLEEHPEIEIVGEASDGNQAIAAIDELEPQIVFLDVHMPLASGIEVIQRAHHKPAVVFTTAYDRYAVSAFELAAVDYLLKPFGRDRFRAALERALQALAQREASGAPAVLERAQQALAPQTPMVRLFVRDRGKIIPLRIEEVARLEAEEDYTRVHAGGRSYLVHVSLNEFEQRLDREHFVRIHRSHMIHLDFIRAIEPHDATRLEVEMKDGTRITASRARSRELRGLIR